MYYPLTVRDFLDRAVHVYPDRVAVVDEPVQPAPSLGEVTYRRLDANARAQAARLDALGVPVGGRVAFISQNSARLLTAFFGVSGYGRILVPINFRLSAAEIGYIVEHSGSQVVYCDPEQKDVLAALDVEHKFLLGDDDDLYLRDAEPAPWDEPDEAATATINYTSGTTARPKGVQLTHRNNWLNAAVFGLHTTISDRDVYLHTLPMFHANGWGMPFGITGVGGLGVRVTIDGDGEVLTASNHNLDGYWQQPDATAQAQQGDWFHTGDGGHLDADGYLVISDRKKDVIISGGENVSSIEVEDALMSHPAVKEVAVIGIPDQKWGEQVTALVVTDGSEVSTEELIAHCRQSLAGYKCPKRVDFVDQLPRTATGKLQKFKLRESFWQGYERSVN